MCWQNSSTIQIMCSLDITIISKDSWIHRYLSWSICQPTSLSLESNLNIVLHQWRNCGGAGGGIAPPFYNACSPHLWKMIYSTKRIVMTIRFYCPPIWGLLLPQNLKFVTPLFCTQQKNWFHQNWFQHPRLKNIVVCYYIDMCARFCPQTI